MYLITIYLHHFRHSTIDSLRPNSWFHFTAFVDKIFKIHFQCTTSRFCPKKAAVLIIFTDYLIFRLRNHHSLVIQWIHFEGFYNVYHAVFACAFSIQISIHNTLLINTAFICIKYARSDNTTRDADENEKAKETTEHVVMEKKKMETATMVCEANSRYSPNNLKRT